MKYNDYIECEHFKRMSFADSSVVIGCATISKNNVVLIGIDDMYKKGAIGVNEGKNITQAFEFATKNQMPVIAIVASSGINVTEGTLALIQMINMTAAAQAHSKMGLLFICVVTKQTLGGVSASFVQLADVIIAEENCIFGFSGKRIIESTTANELPSDFQTAEFAYKNGLVDIVASKSEIKSIITKLLNIHNKR